MYEVPHKLEGEEIIFGYWKCVDCNSVNVGEMENGEIICADCDKEVLGMWKQSPYNKGGIRTKHNFPLVKRLGLDK